MNAELTELVFILDRSGSMGGLESDTIGGFNGMIAKQKAQGKKVNVTTILFDDEVDIIHDRFPVEIIEPLTEKEYFVRGCTALLDAVGTAIEKMENVQKHLPEDHRAGKIIFVITTDGLENSSEHFTQAQIKRKIEAKKECGWEFLFLGANIDAEREAEKLGIARNRSVTYENDSEGIAVNFRAVGNALSKAVTCNMEDDLFHAVRDYWDMRLPPNKKMILSPSIERGLIASNDNSDRVKKLRDKLKGVEINVFQAKYEERRRLQEVLTQIFGSTVFANRLSEIQDLLEHGENKKIIYLSSLHKFGRKQGLEIYDRLKPILYQEA